MRLSQQYQPVTLDDVVGQPAIGPGPTARANAQLSVGENMKPCPKAGCGKTARPV